MSCIGSCHLETNLTRVYQCSKIYTMILCDESEYCIFDTASGLMVGYDLRPNVIFNSFSDLELIRNTSKQSKSQNLASTFECQQRIMRVSARSHSMARCLIRSHLTIIDLKVA